MSGTPGRVTVTDAPGENFIISGKPVEIPVMILSTTVDSGNTDQTYVLRNGLTVAQYTSGDNIVKWGAYNDAGSAGMQTAKGLLKHTVTMRDAAGDVQNTIGIVVIGGDCLIEEDNVHGLDANGKTDLAECFKFSTDYEPS